MEVQVAAALAVALAAVVVEHSNWSAEVGTGRSRHKMAVAPGSRVRVIVRTIFCRRTRHTEQMEAHWTAPGTLEDARSFQASTGPSPAPVRSARD